MVGLDNPLHIAIVLVVVLMLFGAKRLPEMGKGLGEGMRGFKHGLSGTSEPPSQISLAKAEEPDSTLTGSAPQQQQSTPTA